MRSPSENARLVDLEYLEGRTRVECRPALLTIESTSICNLRCVMCPHAIDAVQRPRHMPEELITRLADVMAVASEAQLHGIGEPLSSPAFWRALESQSFHPDCVLNINTNLTLLNARKLALLLAVKAKLRINVSIDAASERTYARIRGAELGEVIDNIRELLAARGDRPYPVVYINMTLMRENIEEAVPFVEMAHRLGVDGVFFYQMNHQPAERMEKYRIDRAGWHFDYTEQGLWNFKALANRCLAEAVERGRQLGMKLFPAGLAELFFDDVPAADGAAEPAPTAVTLQPPTNGATTPAAAVPSTPVDDTPAGNGEPVAESVAVPAAGWQPSALSPKPVPVAAPAAPTIRDCRAPWEWSVISTNGEVLPCCFGAPPVGNLHDTPFEEIWNGEAMQSLRRAISENRIPKACEKGVCKYVLNTRLAREEEARRRAEAEQAEANRRRGLRGLALAGLDLLAAPLAANRARRNRDR
jgi:radical SAM protein with 4Fe4S-binding SPASM domain